MRLRQAFRAGCGRRRGRAGHQDGGFDGSVSGARGEGSGGDPTGRALAKLEAAVERLAEAAARPRPEAVNFEGVPADSVPRAAVAAIADRLDETIARLRAALGEDH
jgi:hypothetical protein